MTDQIDSNGTEEAAGTDASLDAVSLNIANRSHLGAVLFRQDQTVPGNLKVIFSNGEIQIIEDFLVLAKAGLPPVLVLDDGTLVSGQELLSLVENLNFDLLATGAGAHAPKGGDTAGGAGAAYGYLSNEVLGDAFGHGPFSSEDLPGGLEENSALEQERTLEKGSTHVEERVPSESEESGEVSSVAPVDRVPPVFETGNLVNEVEEDTAYVGQFRAIDSEDEVLDYRVVGIDGALFTIDADGNLSFIDQPNYEIPKDADGDNLYEIAIKVTDDAGNSAVLENVQVTVTDYFNKIIGTLKDDKLEGTDRDDILNGGRGGNDTLRGYEGEDKLVGQNWDDKLYGGPGNDLLAGMRGGDHLYGGPGDDILKGGTNNKFNVSDRFYFTSMDDGDDVITDFRVSPPGSSRDRDWIDLDELFDSLGLSVAQRESVVDGNTAVEGSHTVAGAWSGTSNAAKLTITDADSSTGIEKQMSMTFKHFDYSDPADLQTIIDNISVGTES